MIEPGVPPTGIVMTTRTARHRSPPKATSAEGGRALLELADEAEARFAEACEHARLEVDGTNYRLGPSLPLPISRLRPGRIAWARELQTPEGPAVIYYVLDPPARPSLRGAEELPILDLVRSKVHVDLRPAGQSPVRLLGVAESQGTRKGLTKFVRAVSDELASDRE